MPRLHDSPTVDTSVAIIGGGFAGICMAIKLLEAGYDDVTIFEKHTSLGGTWRDNSYPGCACDVPSHLYSFSFAQQAGWTRRFASQAEILAYIRQVAGRHDLERRVLFSTPIRRLAWDDDRRSWRLSSGDGRHFMARVVVSAVGALHVPAYPALEGLDSFAGPALHTARWRDDVDLSGKRVAVIGAGASGVQLVPEIAPRVARLDVYQRTPQWILPRRDRRYSRLERLTYGHVPGLLRASRAWHFWKAETSAAGLVIRPSWMRHGEQRSLRFLERAVADPKLRKKLRPAYRMGCKRVLLSDTFYPALTQPHVELVTDPISRVTPRDIITADGSRRPTDVIIHATGFRAFNPTAEIEIRGRDGRLLKEEWQAGPRAYRGIAVAGYPNYFMLMGPNTGLGHNSIIAMIEIQARHIMNCLSWLRRGLVDAVEVRAEAQQEYNDRLDAALDGTVWGRRRVREQSTCKSWYMHGSGRNTALWPGFATSYWATMLRAERRHFLPALPSGTELPLPLPLPRRRAA